MFQRQLIAMAKENANMNVRTINSCVNAVIVFMKEPLRVKIVEKIFNWVILYVIRMMIASV